MPRLFTYKLTHDTGFAPCPFHGPLTLATCKPGIRKTKIVGDWVAGFTSSILNGDVVGMERLIYLMEVSEKLLIEDCWKDVRFFNKRPIKDHQNIVKRIGDNIYYLEDGMFKQKENNFHRMHHMKKDLGGQFVLISDNYYYFGGKRPLEIPPDLRPDVPAGPTNYGFKSEGEKASRFIKFITSNNRRGKLGPPYKWKVHRSCSSLKR